MNNRLSLVLVIFCLSFSVCAQSDSILARMTWSLSVHAGALLATPGNGGSFTTMLTPGMRYDKLMMTVGVGYDQYSTWRMTPLFAGVGYDLIGGRKSVLFVQLHAGYSHAWSPPSEASGASSNKGGGYFYHPFIGCRITQDKLAVYFTAGYKIQNLTFEENFSWWPSATKKITDARINRFSLQVGVGI